MCGRRFTFYMDWRCSMRDPGRWDRQLYTRYPHIDTGPRFFCGVPATACYKLQSLRATSTGRRNRTDVRFAVRYDPFVTQIWVGFMSVNTPWTVALSSPWPSLAHPPVTRHLHSTLFSPKARAHPLPLPSPPKPPPSPP